MFLQITPFDFSPLVMQCPKCSYTRTESDSLVPDWQCPKCGIVYSKFKKSSEKAVFFTLSSGEVIEVNEIKLYDARRVAQLANLEASIEKNFRGFRTGIGVIGDVEEVVAGKLITGAIDGIVSSAMADTGTKQVMEAQELYRRIRNSGTVVNVAAVENIDLPQPELWKVPHHKTSTKVDLVPLPGKFITVRNKDRDLSIFWDKVESYSTN